MLQLSVLQGIQNLKKGHTRARCWGMKTPEVVCSFLFFWIKVAIFVPWANNLLSIPFFFFLKNPFPKVLVATSCMQKCTKCALSTCKQRFFSSSGNPHITEAWRSDKQSGSCGWVIHVSFLSCVYCLVVQKERERDCMQKPGWDLWSKEKIIWAGERNA